MTPVRATVLLVAILLGAFYVATTAIVNAYTRVQNAVVEEVPLQEEFYLKQDDPNLQKTPLEETPLQQEVLRLPAAGKPAKAVRRVSFCPKYCGPKLAFPASGICVRGRVFAQIGRTDDGLYSLLKPGRYSANADGSPCSFTIKDKCKVGDNEQR